MSRNKRFAQSRRGNMKVKELIKILLKLDQEKNIYLIDNEIGFAYDLKESIEFDKENNGYTL